MYIALVLLLSVGLQFAAAILAARLIRSTGARTGWMLVAVALALMGVRRLVTLTRLVSGDLSIPPDPWAEMIALGISALMLAGVASLGPILGSLRSMEIALRESQRKLSTLMDNLPGMAYRCANDRQWTMEFVSQGCQQLTGYSPADLIGNRRVAYNALIHPDDRQAVWDQVQAALRQRQPFQLVYRIRTASGEEKWVWEQGVGVFDEGQQPVALEGFITDITEQRQAKDLLQRAHDDLEQRVRIRTEELEVLNRQLVQEVAERREAEENVVRQQHMLRQLLDLQERGRQLVAFEIHDGFVQLSAGALMQLQTFEYLQETKPDDARKALHRAMELLQASIAEARRLIGGLRPAALDEAGVVAAIEYLVEETNRAGRVVAEFDCDVSFERLAPPLETTLFRIVQEALSNAVRHSQSDRVRIRMVQREGRVRVEVQDWGIGFDPANIPPGHFGVAGIVHRAKVFGGLAEIHSAPGAGTRIVAELPLVDSLLEPTPP